MSIASLYVLAENLQDNETKNKAVTALHACINETRSNGNTYYVGEDAVKIIYNGTPSNSLMRKFVVDCYSSRAQGSWLKYERSLPDEFVRDLLISVLDKRARTPSTGDITPYMEAI